MKIIPKIRLLNNKIELAIPILLIPAIAYLIWCFSYSAKIDQQNNQIKQSQITKRTIERPQPKPQIAPLKPKFVPDYSIPPIQDGMAPVIANLKTDQKIVFLGIDDGQFKDESVIDLLKKDNIKASLFLSKSFISTNPDFFKLIADQGSVIEDHTLSHDVNMVKDQSYAQQRNEICAMADYELEHYGVRPTLYRPPGGAYSNIMRKAAADCGMKAVVTWIAKANGGSMQYQIGNSLRPGDIVLMHFRPEFDRDMKAFVDAEAVAGLHTELIEDAI